jgi:hypothetical protein
MIDPLLLSDIKLVGQSYFVFQNIKFEIKNGLINFRIIFNLGPCHFVNLPFQQNWNNQFD